MEKNPWYKNVEGPFLQWQGPVGVKADGGGCTRGRGRVGGMVVHRAACNRDLAGESWVLFIPSRRPGGSRGARSRKSIPL
jgi:hypothetical protein